MNEIKRYSPMQLHKANMSTVTAHSGCEGTAPNSREHILAAIHSGAEYVEIDVRYDGEVLYLWHDKLENTAECLKFDALLRLVAPYPTLFINCDVKEDGIASLIVEEAKRYGIEHRILFTGCVAHLHADCEALGATFWHNLHKLKADTKEEAERLNKAQLCETVARCKEIGCDCINSDKRLVNGESIAYLRENGLDFSVWTADSEEQLRFLLENRVANVTTRNPSLALKLRDEIQGSPASQGLLPDGSIEQIIREGGSIMLEANTAALNIKQKCGTANFVTEFDVRVQHFLEKSFKQLIPECKFLAEEEGENENPVGDGYTFVIDPIDGTTNFMLSRRSSCISVALFKDRKPAYGAIFDPYTNRYFAAIPGKGAYCNHRSISVARRDPTVGLADIGTAPYCRDTMADTVTKIFRGLLLHFGDVRRIGSAALSICSVASGEADVFCEPILSPWDFAAGAIILSEAGGIATDFSGDPLPIDKPSCVLMATPSSFETALSLVKEKI